MLHGGRKLRYKKVIIIESICRCLVLQSASRGWTPSARLWLAPLTREHVHAARHAAGSPL